MIILNGKNLGQRQLQLNEKVNEAVKDNTDFNVVKEKADTSDVDKLFKIDLAAKYKNMDYILEVLKCGDRLYISRALDKCSWLYDNDLKHIVNNEYLAKNIFPLMSIKMRNKMLTAIATNLKNGDTRSVEFCAYCMKLKLYNIALKFLIYVPKSFKLEIIIAKTKAFSLITQKEGYYLEHFIGDSFDIAENYVKSFDFPGQKSSAVYLLRYMYSLSNEKYLDMLETCDATVRTLGRRLSKHIIQNHKSRVMKKPLLYVYALNKDVIKRNVKIEEAKVFAVALLPKSSTRFFNSNYHTANKFVLDVIPAQERFTFCKKIFCEKYNNEPFETSFEFYSNNTFEIMTIHERELWALRMINTQNEKLSSGNDYSWYIFINFEKAFNELRKEIMKTTDYHKRSEILIVLLESAQNEEDLTKLLSYYSDRHRNEVPYVSDRFLRKLIMYRQVWHFGEYCWKALEKIFYNLEVFDKSKHQNCDGNYRVVALMYYVINKRSVPEVLHEYIDMNIISFRTIKKYTEKVNHETEIMFQYILQYYLGKIKTISEIPCEEDRKKRIRIYLRCILDLASYFDKTLDNLPEIVLTHIEQDWCESDLHVLLSEREFSLNDIKHYLKTDATLVVTHFPQIKSHCAYSTGNINWLINKLKVYFSHDISEKLLTLFNEYLSADSLNYRIVETAVRGIFILAKKSRKIEIMEKYAPEKTIDKAKICKNTLYIQKAICRQIASSQPPLPLVKVFQYVTGDYVKYCLVLFQSFLVNLPQPQCLDFIQKMINSPVTIQKHGLRLAFECVDTDKLQMIILNSWDKTKNVSLRMVLYKLLSKKISDEIGDIEMQVLFDVLIKLTLELNEDDGDALKVIDTIKLPDHLVGRYLEAVWTNVSKFSEKPKNIERMVNIIKHIERKLRLVPANCVQKIINDHIRFVLDEGQIISSKKQGFDDLVNSKWILTMSSLAYMVNENQFQKNLELAKHITKKCIEMWDKLDENNKTYIVRNFLKRFISDLDIKSYDYEDKCYSKFITLILVIKQDLKKALPEKEIYLLQWYLEASAATKTLILEFKLCSKAMKCDDIKKPGIKLGKDFGMLIKMNVKEEKFYRMFSEQIQNIFTIMIDNFHSHFRRWDLFTSTDILILFCLGLLEHDIFETYMLALNMLPSEYEDKFLNDYLNTIKKIQAFKNTEIQFYVYEKFTNTDFKKRNYIN